MRILIPDLDGMATQDRSPSGIISSILALHPGANVVTILYGSDTKRLTEIAQTASHVQAIQSLYATRGKVGATLFGYDRLISTMPYDDVIVKLDSAKHDPANISKLASLAAEYGAAVGDLDFSQGGLVAGSYDFWVHTNVFPTLYRTASREKLPLSCAHGFQVFTTEVLKKAVDIAYRIVTDVEMQTGEPMKRGLDGAMALSALISGADVQIIKIPSKATRDRTVDEINAQLQQHLHVLFAASRIGLL